MRKQPLLTLTAVLALAVGIGLATTGFTLLDTVLHPRLPFAGGDRYVLVEVLEEPGLQRTNLDDARFRALRDVAALQHLTSFYAALRAPAGMELAGRSLAPSLARIDPRIQVREVKPLESVGTEDRAVFAGIAASLTALGGVAMLLSVISVYAMLSFAVTERRREIAVRSALGATRVQVLRPVIGRASLPLAIGTAAGLPLGRVLTAARGVFAFRLPPDAGPWAIPGLCALIIAAGLIAAWLPARRVVRMSPAEALRAE